MEVGPLIASEIHYDKSGRSLGSGSVVFEEKTDAIRAINQYNGIPLDGMSRITDIIRAKRKLRFAKFIFPIDVINLFSPKDGL